MGKPTKKLQCLGSFGGKGTVKSVNGVLPDETGDVVLAIPDSGGNVAYDEAQELTDEQKAQARENIGAQPKGNYLTEVPEGYAKTEDIPTEQEIIQLIEEHAPESSGGGIAVTGATVGQTVKISEVDENGVPTAWEPTDFPSGGGSEEYEYIGEFNVGDSDVERWDITEDANGKPIRLKEIYFEWLMQPSAATTSNTDLLFGNPLIEMPFVTNVAFYNSRALRTSVNSRYGGNGVHAKHYPSGIYSSGAIRSMIIAFEHASVFAIRWTIGREDSPRGSECIGGLAMKTANASTGLIGAGSTVKIWGVRM